MASYPYEAAIALDPLNPSNVAVNASITLYDPTDVAEQNPLTVTDLNGMAVSLVSSDKGILPSFIAQVPQVRWSGAGYSGLLTSSKGLLEQATAAATSADAARQAAETAASQAQTPTQEMVEGAVDAVLADKDYATTTSVTTAVASRQDVAEKGQAGGYAGLDGSGKVPAAQLPDDIGGGGFVVPSGVVMTADVVKGADGKWPGGGTESTWTRPTASKDWRYRLVGDAPYPAGVESGTGGPLIGWDLVGRPVST